MEDVLGCERSKVARIGTPLGRVALLGVVTMPFFFDFFGAVRCDG